MTGRRVLVWGEGPLADAVAKQFVGDAACVARSRPGEEPAAGVARAVRELGRLDVLVTCPPLERETGRVEDADATTWERLLDGALARQALACRAALPSMRAQQFGRIVTVADRAYLGAPGDAAFAAAAAGLVSLTRTLALEAGRDGITANCVVPGTIDVGQLAALSEAERERRRKLHPGGRFGTPDDVANAVRFFAADESDYITGQTLFVCGGTSVYSSLSV